ncbi:hypothetical protein [Anaerorhabdus sp.]|uniref:hypothetical protein n=1 Tax=Anaerorhabdus sp. TaxID=1872524 RepID=UPI002FC97155
MARKIDIIERLKKKNERPFIMIDEEHSYTVNTSKANVLHIMSLQSEKKEMTAIEQNELYNTIVSLALGDDAVKYIDNLDLSMEAYTEIILAISASISGQAIEDIEKVTNEKK